MPTHPCIYLIRLWLAAPVVPFHKGNSHTSAPASVRSGLASVGQPLACITLLFQRILPHGDMPAANHVCCYVLVVRVAVRFPQQCLQAQAISRCLVS